MHGSLKITRRRGGQVLSFVTGLIASVGASANPVGPQVVNGTVAFANPNPRTLEVTNSPSAIINWQSFDIGARETTRFIQQNAASTVLNRVTTGNSSEILGSLVSNGRVFLINPAGILIGREGSVDTAGVLLSTLQIDDQDFLQGKLAFNAEPGSAGIVNQGYIKTAPGGEVVLIAPRIENGLNGVIESPNGELVLAAGSSITIASLDDPDITFDVRAPDNEVVNLGQLLAKGGTASILAGTIRHSGEINADSLGRDANGRIVLKASKRVELAAE
jgi:filamentous hemagglutinin family protein